MADFAKLFSKLHKQASDRDACAAGEKCPKKRKPAIFVMVARADTADPVTGIEVDVSKPTSQKKKTDGEGLAKFDPAKLGSHVVRFNLSGDLAKKYSPLTAREAATADGKTSTFMVLVHPLPLLQVVIERSDNHKAVGGVKVELTGPEPLNGTTAEGSGLTKFERIKPGKYSIEVKLTEAQATEFMAPPVTKVTMVAGKDQKVTIPISPTVGNAVRITKLSRWFVPNVEPCDIGYSLEGSKRTADKLMLEVFASNYCELDSWNDGLPKFKVLANTPVFTRALGGEFSEERAAKTIDDWQGLTNCTKGIMAPGADGMHRFLNVACSPYTVHFRYYKDDADAKARIDLAPFWPLFDSAGAPTADSLKVKYAVAETTKLKSGKVVIWDKTDKEVFARDLAEADLSKGEHTFAWDGKLKDGNKISAAGMPYRAQVQGHTKKGELKGLALAALHTEVRLYVHPETLKPDTDPYVAVNDKSSLRLGFAHLYHKDKDPAKDADGKVWTKFMLARHGFHPGPVNDATANTAFKTALAEFQRSVPKNTAAPFERLTISSAGNDDNDTKAALTAVADRRRRPWFGKVADKSDYNDANERRTDFCNPAKTMILWVDDRHWYTNPSGWLNKYDDVAPKIVATVTGHRTALNNTRGQYTDRDNRVTYDEAEIARPWIPVQVEFRLLRKNQHLSDKIDDTPDDKLLAAMRQAIGPLRVDWSFDEIDGDTIQVPEVDRSLYHKERTRTRAALEWALNDLKTADYARKDVKRKAAYFNCPVNNGGIRPANGAGYYKAAFGLDGDALLPWKTADETGRETVVTVVHDRIGQAGTDLFAKRQGRAGVYFHPSRMAGDGYRLRAQVWFAPHPNYTFANFRILSQRYPLLPQAHTAALRLWRKSSIRGYVQWGPNNNWPGTRAGMLTQYHAAHVHLVNELGVPDADINMPLSQIWDGGVAAELAAYRAVIKSCVAAGADPKRTDANIQISATQMWPWTPHGNLGMINPVGPNPPNAGAVWRDIYSQATPFWMKLTNRLAVELADVMERKRGRMRGHIIVEFVTTTNFCARGYQCNNASCNPPNPPRIYYYCTKDAVTVTHHNVACPSGCGGRLQDLGAGSVFQWPSQLPASSLGDPLGVSYNFDGTARLWAHELGHNRYYEHAANAGGAHDVHHDHVNNPAVSGSTWQRPAPPQGDGTFATQQWDRTCLMSYVGHLNGVAGAMYDAGKDVAFFCFRCVLKNRGWKLAGVNSPPAATKDP